MTVSHSQALSLSTERACECEIKSALCDEKIWSSIKKKFAEDDLILHSFICLIEINSKFYLLRKISFIFFFFFFSVTKKYRIKYEIMSCITNKNKFSLYHGVFHHINATLNHMNILNKNTERLKKNARIIFLLFIL